MELSAFGKTAESEWKRTGEIRGEVQVDEFSIMPNHIHGILILHESTGATRRVAPTEDSDPSIESSAQRPHGPRAGSIGAVIGQYKSAVARSINALRGTTVPSIWQRNYHEHVIRDETDLMNIREYIRNNPLKWMEDRENPEFQGGRRGASPLRIENQTSNLPHDPVG